MTEPQPADPESQLPRALIALASAWCLVFPVLGLATTLFAFADGGLFAYAAAAGEGWELHWRNIPGRIAAFAAAGLPGALAARAAADPSVGLAVYGACWLLAPALGLAATAAADRSGGRVFTLWAAASTALALPLVYGFPTELWIAHAAFWPALALLNAPGGPARTAAAAVATAILVLSHEGGAVWAVVAVGALAFGPAGALRRGAACLAAALVAWAALKLAAPPTPYVSDVLTRNALGLLNPLNLAIPMALEIGAALAAFAAGFLAGGRGGARWLRGLVAALAALALWRALAGDGLHAADRYAARTILLGLVPLGGLAAALHAGGAAGRFGVAARRRAAEAALGAALAVSAAHALETARFAAAWSAYAAEMRALATGGESDPALGDPAFVSAARLADHGRIGWHSTTPFLSAVLAPGAAPARLVVDPDAGYFWFGCETAEAHRDAPGPVGAPTRALVARYTCLHQ